MGREPTHVHMVDRRTGCLDGVDGVEVVGGWRQGDVVLDPADVGGDVPDVMYDAPDAGSLSDVKDSQ
jgi:hypothetical protein